MQIQAQMSWLGFKECPAVVEMLKYLNTLARKSPLEHSAFRSSTSWTYICKQKKNILEGSRILLSHINLFPRGGKEAKNKAITLVKPYKQ